MLLNKPCNISTGEHVVEVIIKVEMTLRACGFNLQMFVT